MTLESSTRFAQISLSLFGHEGRFRIEVPSGEDFERTAEAFERAGAAVERQPLERCLVVTLDSTGQPAPSDL